MQRTQITTVLFLFAVVIGVVSVAPSSSLSLIPSVSAQEKAEIEVPFDYHTSSGTLYVFEEHYEYIVKFIGDRMSIVEPDNNGNLPDCESLGLVYDPPSEAYQDGRCVTPEILETEAKADYIEEMASEDLNEDGKISEDEKIISQIEAKDEVSFTDYQLKKLLEERNQVCELGIEEGRLIQNYEQLEIPPEDAIITTYKGIDYKNHPLLAQITKDILQCEYWNDYKAAQLGLEYLNKSTDAQRYHAELAEGLKIYPQAQLPVNAMQISEDRATYAICNYNYYGWDFKIQQGCENTLDYDGVRYGGNLPRDYALTDPYQAWIEWSKNPDSNLDETQQINDKRHNKTQNIGGQQTQ